MNDSDALDALDYMYQGFKPFVKKPNEAFDMLVNDFLDFMGFQPGTLHKSHYEFHWLFGDLENPTWLGQTDYDLNEITFTTEPEEVFLIVGPVLLRSTYENPNKPDEYTYVLKIMVRDKVGYLPIPIDQMEENGANHFKRLFEQVIPDN